MIGKKSKKVESIWVENCTAKKSHYSRKDIDGSIESIDEAAKVGKEVVAAVDLQISFVFLRHSRTKKTKYAKGWKQ